MLQLLLIFALVLYTAGQDNAVVGLPVISCDDHEIRVDVNTMDAFGGRIFVKGEHSRKECVSDYSNVYMANSESLSMSSQRVDSLIRMGQREDVCPPCDCVDNPRRSKREGRSNIISIQVPLDKCNLQRDRIASPPGVRISFVVVISFHKSFITKQDRAYHVQCLYAESDRIITTKVDVGMQESLNVSGSVAPSSCQYSIRDANGIAVKSVRVGDVVTHTWECISTSTQIYSLLVHDCTVEDNSGGRSQIIDERGCSLDPSVIPSPSYSSPLTASLDSYVFKFPDQSSIGFMCSLSLCLRGDEECKAMTPPDCSLSSRSRRSLSPLSSSQLPTWTLHSSRLTVVDGDVPLPSRSLTPLLPPAVCLSVASFGVFISFITCVLTTSLIALYFIYKPGK